MSPRTTTDIRPGSPRAAVTALSEPAAETAITAATKLLGLPTIRDEHARIAEAAARERLSTCLCATCVGHESCPVA